MHRWYGVKSKANLEKEKHDWTVLLKHVAMGVLKVMCLPIIAVYPPLAEAGWAH